MAAATWTHRNIASVTENGVADVTLTFQEAYQATPAAVIGPGESASTLAGAFVSMTAGSLRLTTRNGSLAATVARKTSVIVTGII